MIGIDRVTGQQIDDFEQFTSRVIQVLTTAIGGREKRQRFGSRVRNTLGHNNSNATLSLVQNYALEAFYVPENGLSDFLPSRCVARPTRDGITLSISGVFNGFNRTLEVPISAAISTP
jgi:hypothetical protein